MQSMILLTVNCIDIIDFLLISVHCKTYMLLLYSIGYSFCSCLYWSPRFGNCFLLYNRNLCFLFVVKLIDNIDFLLISVHHKTYILLLYSIGNSFCYTTEIYVFLLVIKLIDNMDIIDFIYLSIISIRIYLYKNYRYL